MMCLISWSRNAQRCHKIDGVYPVLPQGLFSSLDVRLISAELIMQNLVPFLILALGRAAGMMVETAVSVPATMAGTIRAATTALTAWTQMHHVTTLIMLHPFILTALMGISRPSATLDVTRKIITRPVVMMTGTAASVPALMVSIPLAGSTTSTAWILSLPKQSTTAKKHRPLLFLAQMEVRTNG